MVRIHPKYGLNPTISVCIVCGKETGDIALLGDAYTEQAPMHCVTSPIPCAACRKRYLDDGDGVMLFESNGSIAIIKREAFERFFNVPVPEGRIAKAEDGLLEKMGCFDARCVPKPPPEKGAA